MVGLWVSIYVSAYDFNANGIYYNVKSVTNETCAVTKAPEEYSGVVEIPSEVQYGGRLFKVTEIEASAFENNSDITEVYLGENIEKIGERTFENCSNIETIVFNCINCKIAGSLEYPSFNKCMKIANLQFGENVTRIPNYLMKNAGEFLDLHLEEGVRYIGEYAFASHSEIINIMFPSTLKIIEEHAFEGCSGIKELFMPDSITTINKYAFSGCSSISKINFSKSLEIISDFAFQNCEKIDRIDLDECRLSTLGVSSFYNCLNMAEVKFPINIETIGSSAFGMCVNLQTLDIPETVISIGKEAFINCTKLKAVNFNNCSATIGEKAFWGTHALIEIDLGDNIKSIEKGAFEESGIESITIPSSVSTLGPDIFGENLKELIIADSAEPLSFKMDTSEAIAFYCYTAFGGKDAVKSVSYRGLIAPNIEKLYLG